MVLFTAPYGKGLSQKLSKGTYYVELAQAFAYQVNDYEYDYEESAKKELQYEIFCNNIKMKLDKDEKVTRINLGDITTKIK